MAQNRHEMWASQKAAELAQLGGGVHLKLVPYDILIGESGGRRRRRRIRRRRRSGRACISRRGVARSGR